MCLSIVLSFCVILLSAVATATVRTVGLLSESIASCAVVILLDYDTKDDVDPADI